MGRHPRRRGALVVGQFARDLVLEVEQLPDAGGSTSVRRRAEMLGGKGANQAVGLRQLGVTPVAVLGVVGEDAVGAWVRAQAEADDLDVTPLVRRGSTALLLDVIADDRHLFEDVPDDSLFRVADVRAARQVFADVGVVSLQLQQTADVVTEVARLAHAHDALLVLDGAPPEGTRDALLGRASILRADAVEARAWTGDDVSDPSDAERAAADLLSAGPSLVALEVPGHGDLVAWRGGHRLLPHSDGVVDPTGGGDAFTAGLVASLINGLTPAAAGELAARAAAATVSRRGGRPDLGHLRP